MITRKKQWEALFTHAAAGVAIVLVVLHQSLIAASAYYLTQLIEAFQKGGDLGFYLVAYLITMVAPYLPGCLSIIFLQKWINSAHKSFLDRFAGSLYTRIQHYRNAATRESVEGVATRTSLHAISAYLSFFHDFVTFLLNSFLSMVVIGFLLPSQLMLGYFSSVLLCAIIVYLMRSRVSRSVTASEQSLINYGGSLSRIWDNVLLGNNYNYTIWKTKTDTLGDDYYKRSLQAAIISQVGNFILAMAALLPTIYLVAHTVSQKAVQPEIMAAIIVNLTRIFHILGSLSALVYRVLDWSSMNAYMRIVFDAESIEGQGGIPDFPPGAIYLNEMEIKTYDHAFQLLISQSTGRFTVRGDNGSGKSTLLQYLKFRLSDQAILMPANVTSLDWNVELGDKSTGERVLAAITEVENSPEKYLLLDEWDANLDARNIKATEKLLIDCSARRVVVEVRHRSTSEVSSFSASDIADTAR